MYIRRNTLLSHLPKLMVAKKVLTIRSITSPLYSVFFLWGFRL